LHVRLSETRVVRSRVFPSMMGSRCRLLVALSYLNYSRWVEDRYIVIPSSSRITFLFCGNDGKQYRLYGISAMHSSSADATTNSSIITARGRYLNGNVNRFVSQQDYLQYSTSAKLSVPRDQPSHVHWSATARIPIANIFLFNLLPNSLNAGH